MGLFGNFTKEGRGVSKNAPQKKRFFLFFELFFRKITKLSLLNMIYFICNIPLFLGIILSVGINPEFLTSSEPVPPIGFTGSILGAVLIFAAIFITGPATAGLTYVLRNYARQEHSWVISDFFEHFRKNFKQASALCAIDVVVAFCVYILWIFYNYTMPQMYPNMASIAALCSLLFIIIAIFYVMMHFYMYIMMVTFDLKLKVIIKNALLFTLAKLPQSVLILIVNLAITFLIGIMSPVLMAIASFFIALSLTGFITVFFAYPTIEQHMMPEKYDNDDDEKYFSDTI